MMSAQAYQKWRTGSRAWYSCLRTGGCVDHQFINEPPDVLGKHIGAALVGTFLVSLPATDLWTIGTQLENKPGKEKFYSM
jgi:hypothetical protein